MPDFVQIASVVPELHALPHAIRTMVEDDYPDACDDLHTSGSLKEAVEKIARAAPTLDLRIVYDGRTEWFDLRAIGIRSGAVWHDTFTLSESGEANIKPPIAFAPDVALSLDVPGDRLVDIVTKNAEEYEECDADGSTIRLPLVYTAPLDALAVVAAHIANESETFIVKFDDGYYAVVLRRGKDVTLNGLHVWHPDSGVRAAGQTVVVSRRGTFTKAAHAAPEFAPSDDARPLVTGSAASREEAAMKLMPAYYDDGWDDSIKPTSPELMETLIMAARAPENAGSAFASVRRTLYEYIADFKAIEGGRALIALLDQEKDDPEMRIALYGHIAQRRGKNPGRVMVRAYREERDLRHRIGKMLWKHDAAVGMLVRDELVPAWRSDPEYAKGIVKLLRRELIRVPASWVEGADAALVSALGDLVQDGA